jgi:ParB family transcriptional regulator, chromosome partitioning protein
MSYRHGAPGGLGRGLGALIRTGPHAAPAAHAVDISATDPHLTSTAERADPPAPDPASVDAPGVVFAELEVTAIRTNPRQPRQVFDDDALTELTHSVREFGVLQPVVVRRLPDDGFQLVMGERRLRAAVGAGLTHIPALIRETADDAMLRDALVENLHRTGLNPLEEAAAYQQLLSDFDVTHEELATRIGRSRSQITNTIRLLNLSVPVQRRIAAGVLSAGHARALLGLDDRDAQDELAARIVAEGLSVRATEEIVATAGREAPAETRPHRRGSAPRITAPALRDLAERLSDTLDTRVRVDLGRRKGRITVEFASVDDLERIVGVIAPELAVARGAEPTAAGHPNEP